jgi:hypothetical protein
LVEVFEAVAAIVQQFGDIFAQLEVGVAVGDVTRFNDVLCGSVFDDSDVSSEGRSKSYWNSN